jgi:uncharacterized protein DUF1588/uncharacterized protein DUF1592/uncharacterized protein DUF1595/uncharacterized protein DUF1587
MKRCYLKRCDAKRGIRTTLGLVIGLASLAGCTAAGDAGGEPTYTDPNPDDGKPGNDPTGNPNDGKGPSNTPDDGNVREGDATARCSQSRAGVPDLRRLSRFELERSLGDVFPQVAGAWTSTLSADTVSPAGFDNDSTMLVVSRQSARELADTAESLAAAVSGAALATILPCSASAADANCAGTFIDSYGRRLFRRPVEAAERTQYLDFFNTALTATGSFPEAIGWLTRGLIESPSFIYRRELGAAEGDLRKLNQYEIAAELAFTYTASTPSDALLDRASRAELSSPEALVSTAKELLLSPRGRDVVQHFFDAFVGYGRVTTLAKSNDAQAFEARRGEMAEETRRFIDEVVVTRLGGVRELLTASFTMPTQQLATFYGMPAPAADYTTVERRPGEGIGLLAQGSFLSTYAQPNGSSPTKRGVWVYKHLLCQSVPAVPPNIPEIKPPRENITTRQRYEEEHASGGCRNCHSMWDPIGFGMEHFNELGRFRTTEGTLAIDTNSYVPDGNEAAGRDPYFSFTTQEELARGLAEMPLVNECVSGAIATFAFGETVSCSGETRRQAFVDGEIGFVDYLASLAAEPQFVQRRASQDE